MDPAGKHSAEGEPFARWLPLRVDQLPEPEVTNIGLTSKSFSSKP
jgi:hypothetical protein